MGDRREPLVLGIDLGGTKIAAAVVTARGEILSRDHRATPAAEGPEAVIHAMVESAHRASAQAGTASSKLDAIGVGAPGLSNPDTGILFTSPNLPGWQDVPLRDVIAQEMKAPAFLINDANAAALGELYFGAGRGARHLIYITLSTGIGGGLVVDGRLLSGSTGAAGEVGHMTIDDDGPACNCGNVGCWEVLASGTALAREARQRIEAGAMTSILDHAHGDKTKVTAEAVQSAAEQGDELAKALVARTAHYVGVGLANLINLFNPECIVIGGGLSNMGEMLLEPAYRTAERRAFREAFRAVRFVRAELGQDSGVLGAAAFALEEIEKDKGPRA